MTLHEIKQRYHSEIVEYMLDSLYNTPTHDLVEELLYYMDQDKLDRWAKTIQSDFEISDLYNDGIGSISV